MGWAPEAAGMNKLIWTTTRPTQPGWYWYRRSGSSVALLIHHGLAWDQIVKLLGVDEPVTFVTEKLVSGQWAGPLEPPTQSPPLLEAGLRVS
jgi:hypothetical protein